MKRQILKLTGMLALVSGAATTLTADYASTVSNLKPVAFWRLNETTQPPPPTWRSTPVPWATPLWGIIWEQLSTRFLEP